MEFPLKTDFFPQVRLTAEERRRYVATGERSARVLRNSMKTLDWKKSMEKDGVTYAQAHCIEGSSGGSVPSSPSANVATSKRDEEPQAIASACLMMSATAFAAGTISEALEALASPVTEDYRRAMHFLHGPRFVDGVCLHTIPAASPNNAKSNSQAFTTIKWAAFNDGKALNSTGAPAGTDYCFLEHSGIHRSDTGSDANELFGFSIQESITREGEVPSLAGVGLARGHLHRTGILILPTDRPDVVQVTSILQMPMASRTGSQAPGGYDIFVYHLRNTGSSLSSPSSTNSIGENTLTANNNAEIHTRPKSLSSGSSTFSISSDSQMSARLTRAGYADGAIRLYDLEDNHLDVSSSNSSSYSLSEFDSFDSLVAVHLFNQDELNRRQRRSSKSEGEVHDARRRRTRSSDAEGAEGFMDVDFINSEQFTLLCPETLSRQWRTRTSSRVRQDAGEKSHLSASLSNMSFVSTLSNSTMLGDEERESQDLEHEGFATGERSESQAELLALRQQVEGLHRSLAAASSQLNNIRTRRSSRRAQQQQPIDPVAASHHAIYGLLVEELHEIMGLPRPGREH
ncbi:hypothetical protein JG687_00002876 [Phytophthora cactorum]|uniref:Uncharacterized protein n=1 Tax=Phytophthora cactorum TaxID=29920 RepID=A0A8T1UT43_9STRA|nr:hypothetical protein JG687_00002876 [Phytophthora cactorum]